MNVDSLLGLVAQGGWVLFALYVLALFIYTARSHGLVIESIRMISVRVIIPLLLTISISFLSLAVVFVEPQYVGIVVSIISPGGIRPKPISAGLHVIVPILEWEVQYPIYWQTYTMSSTFDEGNVLGDDSIRARTSDGQEVSLGASIIYRVDAEQAVTVHTNWQDRYTEDFVRPMLQGEIRSQVSQFQVREVNSSARKDLEVALEILLKDAFFGQGLIVDRFLVRDVTFTDLYNTSVEEKQAAFEGIEKAKNQATQIKNLAQGEQDRLTIIAEGQKIQIERVAFGEAEAVRVKAQANAEARIVQGEADARALRFISEVIEDNPDMLIYNYTDKIVPNIRVMLVPNDTPLILPLDDLIQPDTTANISPTEFVSTTANVDSRSNVSATETLDSSQTITPSITLPSE
ncbi:MAG: prohibitin family protein [Chloroflexota bacterium]